MLDTDVSPMGLRTWSKRDVARATRVLAAECKQDEGAESDQEAASTIRVPEHPADRLFVDRWSPRGFTQDQILEGVLNTFFEAARWAPPAFNSQPWRFLYALRGYSEFDAFLTPLIEFNKDWARHAAALVYLLSRRDYIPTCEDRTATLANAFLRYRCRLGQLCSQWRLQ